MILKNSKRTSLIIEFPELRLRFYLIFYLNKMQRNVDMLSQNHQDLMCKYHRF